MQYLIIGLLLFNSFLGVVNNDISNEILESKKSDKVVNTDFIYPKKAIKMYCVKCKDTRFIYGYKQKKGSRFYYKTANCPVCGTHMILMGHLINDF